jgi:hypothetical protein
LAAKGGLSGLAGGGTIKTSLGGRDQGVRLRDLDGDGVCELLVSNPDQQAIFQYDGDNWRR